MRNAECKAVRQCVAVLYMHATHIHRAHNTASHQIQNHRRAETRAISVCFIVEEICRSRSPLNWSDSILYRRRHVVAAHILGILRSNTFILCRNFAQKLVLRSSNGQMGLYLSCLCCIYVLCACVCVHATVMDQWKSDFPVLTRKKNTKKDRKVRHRNDIARHRKCVTSAIRQSVS